MSRRFRFNLQPALDLRRRIEEERQMEVARVLRILNDARSELWRLQAEFRRYSDVLRSDHRALQADDLRMHYAHLEYLDRAITRQESTVQRSRVDHERARLRLVDAAKDKKVLEKLKERRFAAHVLNDFAIEQKELDDTNARRWSRSLAAGGML